MSNDGGPAFPATTKEMLPPELWTQGGDSTAQVFHPGMSLRDYFAAAALAFSVDSVVKRANATWEESIALDAYDIADAMLKERAK